MHQQTIRKTRNRMESLDEQECGNAFLLFKDVIDKYRTFLAKMQRDGRYRQETIKSYSSYLRNMEIFNEEKKVPITYIYQFDKDFCVMLLDEVYITRITLHLRAITISVF